MKSIRIVVIGLGHHARRMYMDFNDSIPNATLVGVVDLASQEKHVLSFLREKKIDVTPLFINYPDSGDGIDKRDQIRLDRFIDETGCDAVIISTEPLSHFRYVTWALKRDLHILLDKPITTEINVSSDVKKARKLYKDYKRIARLYSERLRHNNLVFVLQAQRRFHAGFRFAKEKIAEIHRMTSCPVTSIQSLHSDGQWRLPDEIVDIDYHSYNQNYGKMSHSGYHSLDISLWLSELPLSKEKQYSKVEVYSKFSRPFDYLSQIEPKDYPLFMKDFTSRNDAAAYRYKLKIEGEIDAFNSISLLNSKGALITHISSSMIHNGFSQRGWFQPNLENLYKGNGRVRHESYIIEQGPFQCIIINSFQSHELLKKDRHAGVGGEDHFDVHVFRNSSLFPSLNPYELHTIDRSDESQGYSRGHNEQARRDCLSEFVKSIEMGRPPASQVSNLYEHRLSTNLLGAVYESSVRDLKNKNMVVKLKI